MQEETMATQKLLVETLNQLSPEDFVVFKLLIEDDNVLPLLPRKELKAANTQDVVKLMLKAHGQQSVEETRDVLKKMRKMDLVKRLSAIKSDSDPDPDPDPYQYPDPDPYPDPFPDPYPDRYSYPYPYLYPYPYADSDSDSDSDHYLPSIQRPDTIKGNEWLLPLTERVEALESATRLLLETLDLLGDEDKEHFKKALSKTHQRRSDSFHILLELTDLQDKVLLMVYTYGSRSVEKITEVLKKMKKTELVQRLTDGSSVTKETHRDEHLSALIHKVVTMRSVEEVLLETLTDLSTEDLKKVKWLLQATCYQRNLPQLSWRLLLTEDLRKLAGMIVRTYGQQSVEVAVEVFTDMNRTDLVQRLSGSSSGPKERPVADEHWLALIQKVETLSSDTELLLETLADLSDEELKVFKDFVQTQFNILWSSSLVDLQDIVFLMVQAHGQRSVNNFVEILKRMKKHKLVKRLSDRRSASKQKPSDGVWHSAFIRKVSTVAAVKHLLLEIVSDLRKQEIQQFKNILEMVISRKGFSHFSWGLDKWSTVVEVVGMTVQILGRQSVEVTRQALLYMNRTDLVQRFPEISSGLEGNIGKIIRSLSSEFSGGQIKDQGPGPKIRFDGPALLVEEAETKWIFSMNLADFTRNELLKFKWFLQFTCFQKSLPQIPKDQLAKAFTIPKLVDLMLERLGERSVEVIREVSQDMKKILVTEPSASAGEVASKFLQKIGRNDLVQMFSDKSLAFKGPSRSLQPKSVKQESIRWTDCEPEVSSTDGGQATTYRLQSGPGHFECSVSGLRWVCQQKSILKYQFGSWQGHVDRMESRQFLPAGPLMDVTVIEGKLKEVYLPHWICIEDNPEILDKFAVLHIDDCGDVVENVSEVTATHVKLTEPTFSLLAALMKVGLRLKYRCNVLLYKTNTAFLTLHVYLIPDDPGLQKAIDQKQESYGYEVIRKPDPESLKICDRFILTTDLKDAEITPKSGLKFEYPRGRPNFFEVYIEKPDGGFTLKLSPRKEHQPVWDCVVRKDEYQSCTQAAASSSGATGLTCMADVAGALDEAAGAAGGFSPMDYSCYEEEHFVDKHSDKLIQRDSMRALFSGPLKAGKTSKDIFYSILQQEEPHLITSLKSEQ
ncbi:uncharacterized protein LOC133440652 [Cololabis saira]|uniref:uncharacterized protein LOC133440652 n=1 Tax=Cololabis saira TaxID=129043 RepID=UPI002AD4033D|nr:uncharacterized protein LOC133440652 [Cololabis saira]